MNGGLSLSSCLICLKGVRSKKMTGDDWAAEGHAGQRDVLVPARCAAAEGLGPWMTPSEDRGNMRK